MNNLKLSLIPFAFLLFLLIPCRVSAQDSSVDLSYHIPIFSAGLMESSSADSPHVFQLVGYGFTSLNFGRLRFGGVEASLIVNNHEVEFTAPSGVVSREADPYLGIGLISPVLINMYKSKPNEEDLSVSLRIGVGYGLFGGLKPSRIVLVGFSLSSK